MEIARIGKVQVPWLKFCTHDWSFSTKFSFNFFHSSKASSTHEVGTNAPEVSRLNYRLATKSKSSIMQTSKHPENCCARLNQKSFEMNRKMFLSSILPAFFFVVYTPHRLRATQNISRTPHRKCVLTFCALLLAFFFWAFACLLPRNIAL